MPFNRNTTPRHYMPSVAIPSHIEGRGGIEPEPPTREVYVTMSVNGRKDVPVVVRFRIDPVTGERGLKITELEDPDLPANPNSAAFTADLAFDTREDIQVLIEGLEQELREAGKTPPHALGEIAASGMYSGAVLGVKDDRVKGIPTYEPPITVVPDDTRPTLKVYELEEGPKVDFEIRRDDRDNNRAGFGIGTNRVEPANLEADRSAIGEFNPDHEYAQLLVEAFPERPKVVMRRNSGTRIERK